MSARCRGYFLGQPTEFEGCGTSTFGVERGSTAIPFKEISFALTVSTEQHSPVHCHTAIYPMCSDLSTIDNSPLSSHVMTIWKHPNVRIMRASRYGPRTAGVHCDDVLILVFHAAFENDRFPLKQHASVISACPERQRPVPHRSIYIVFPHKTRSCKEGTPLNAPSVCVDTSIVRRVTYPLP
jgi:hypothetical protein